MSYLVENDFKKSLRDVRLSQIVDGNSTLLDDASDAAEAIVRDYLNSRYNVEEIFNKTGNDRHKQVVRWTLLIALYIIYDRIEDDLVPERVIKNYDETIATLKEICDAKMEAVLPRRVDEKNATVTKFRWGSNKRRKDDPVSGGEWEECDNPDFRD